MISVRAITKLIGVSRSGYFSWKKRTPSPSKRKKASMKQKIQEIYEASHRIYGAPKISRILWKQGYRITEKTVGNYMREIGIRAKYVSPYTRTTISKEGIHDLKNILKREFNPDKPDAVWCTDITYIYTHGEGFVYLTSIMDLYSRKIVSWELTRNMRAEHVLESVKKAKYIRNIQSPLVIHSDRGIQFTSKEYEEITAKMKCSYSRKGNPWDNACIESFHALIKREWLKDKWLWNYNQAYWCIYEYIETFYNTVRIHSHCNYESPNDYEKEYYKKQG